MIDSLIWIENRFLLSCLRLPKIFRDKYEDWNCSCPFFDMEHAENIEHLLMTCLKWNKGKDATDKGDHEGLGKDQPVEIAYC